MIDDLSVWERFSRPDERGVPPAPRSATAAPLTPSARLIQVEQELALAKTYLQNAVHVITRLQAKDDHWHSFATSFGGVPCQQYWADFALWEAILNTHRGITSICELGTGDGGFSWYLWAQAHMRDLRFRTYDSVTINPGVPEHQRVDVFLGKRVVLEWIGDKPTVLFCDNGNKPREIKEYSPHLAKGSIVVVHDWGTEFTNDDVPEWMEEIYGDFCDMIGSASRVFQRKEKI